VNIDVPEDATDEMISAEIKKIVDEADIFDYDEYNDCGLEEIEAYKTSDNTEIALDF
jgi:hypothetical protein